MEITFEHDYQNKVMNQVFSSPFVLKHEADLQTWRQLWMNALKSWHSPYKAVIDGRQLTLDSSADKEQMRAAFLRLEKLMSGFFLKKAVIYGVDPELAAIIPFESFAQEDAALAAVGANRQRKAGVAGDLRASIQLQNHFKQHVVELSLAEPVVLDSSEKIAILRSKLTNNLMQWHSAWNLLVDCQNLEIAPEVFPEFESMLRFFRGFFLKEILGYSPKEKGLTYPFQVYRARHNAAGRLEAEGLFSGEDANCRTRKPGEPG